MLRKTTLAIAAGLMFGAMGLAAPASASEAHFETQRVRAADLDLNREPGATALLGRIKTAARAACGFRSGPMTLIDRQVQRQCIADAQERAVTELNRPVVTAVYYNRRPAIIFASN